MLAGAVDEKDPYTRGHSDRVTRYSLMIAKEMGLDPGFLEILRVSAQLHDVGKIGIEDRILKKPGALTPEEFEIMKTHTTKGANILRPVPQLREMLPGIELHHEALNGRGYPYGLKGDEIPLLPRVIAVADTFDALTTNRPYQQAYDPVEALRIIENLSGQRLDPRAVTAIMAVFLPGRHSHSEIADADGPAGNASTRSSAAPAHATARRSSHHRNHAHLRTNWQLSLVANRWSFANSSLASGACEQSRVKGLPTTSDQRPTTTSYKLPNPQPLDSPIIVIWRLMIQTLFGSLDEEQETEFY